MKHVAERGLGRGAGALLAGTMLACARIQVGGADAGASGHPADATSDGNMGGDLKAGSDATAADQGNAVDRYSPDLIGVVDATDIPGVDATCAMQSAVAETLPLDLYVMVDSSGSMTELTAAGTTKWDALRGAMTTFLNDPQSAGLGVGLQYFPLLQPGVPEECSGDAACGKFGPCTRFRTCYGPATTTVVSCSTNADCKTGETCSLLGECPLTPGGYCAPVGIPCLLGDLCTAIPGFCEARDRCDVPSYATPAVAIAALPGAAPALISSLGAHQPDGRTPTGPALAGALNAARTQATAHPDHKLAVVLVTDGLPTECTPLDIPAIAAIAAAGAAGTPAVPTFVIGVFGADDAALAAPNLNALAAGGGTGKAVVINTNQDVNQVLQAALAQIRTTAVACEYRIPPATAGTIAFGKVNVQLTDATGMVTTVGYVNGKDACNPTRGGWYYDRDPASGQPPQSIITCDATCAQFRATASARVDIVLGCQTIVIP